METERKLRKLVRSVLDGSPRNKETEALLDGLDISLESVEEAYVLYNQNVHAYSNEIYASLGTRFAMYLQHLLPGSWHVQRQQIVLDMIEKIGPRHIADMGFGIPGKYIRDYVLKRKAKATLSDFEDSAFLFSEKLLSLWNPRWSERISFEKVNMNSRICSGEYDCYLFLDSLEHVDSPARYLKRAVKKSRPGSRFIFSLSVGPTIPSHSISWKSEQEIHDWLTSCGLTIDRVEKVYPNPKVDLFAQEIEGEIYDLVVSCRKQYDIARLPLLDAVKSFYSKRKLDNTLLIGCHHLLESNLILLDYLLKLGIKPEDTFFIGKSYSTSEKTLKDYLRLGVSIDARSSTFDSHRSFDEQFEQHIRKFLRNIMKIRDVSSYDRILILDDGVHLLTCAHEFFSDDERVVGVEQTSSGYRKLQQLSVGFPVINVATSQAKLDHETPFIVEAFSKELYKRLRQMDREVENVLVIGNGAIGQGIASELRHEFRVSIYDSEKSKSELTDREFPIALTGADLVIGCSGGQGIPTSFYPLLKKDVILVSASSSDREFASHLIRRNHAPTSNTHKDFYDDVILLNGGFPLNFDGHKLSVPLEQIQLTEALMFAAALQALQISFRKEIVELDPEVQNFIVEQFEELCF